MLTTEILKEYKTKNPVSSPAYYLGEENPGLHYKTNTLWKEFQ